MIEGDDQKTQFDYDHVKKKTLTVASRKVENCHFKPFHTQTPNNTHEPSPHVQKIQMHEFLLLCTGPSGQPKCP